MAMLVVSQTPSSGPHTLTTTTTTTTTKKSCTCSTSTSSSSSSSIKFVRSFYPTTPFSSSSSSSSSSRLSRFRANSTPDNGTATKQSPPPPPPVVSQDGTVFVGQDGVPLEGVIQFDKPGPTSRFQKWGKIALLAGGDVLALLLFAAIGRFSHGFPVLDVETLRTADPFIAGWFLSAYFLGGYAEDGRGMNGSTKATFAAAKSWALGIPMGVGIRALTSGHMPPANFILVSLGSTAVLLIGWRTLLFQILPTQKIKKDDTYRRGSPFELFELLTSLVRRW